MLYSILMLDKPGSQDLRAETRDAHRAYVTHHGPKMRMGGPLFADDNQTITGSLIVMEFADRQAAELFAAQEPYNQAGLFETVVIRPFHAVVDNAAADVSP